MSTVPTLDRAAGIENSWATTILFCIEFQWLLKGRWFREFWCQLHNANFGLDT